MAPDRLGVLGASANLAIALNLAGKFVPDARRDEFEEAVVQVIACVLDMPAEQARAHGVKVRAEIAAEAARRTAAQS